SVNPNTCQTVTSVASSSWSLTGTWDTGFVPTFCNAVVIGTTTIVTLDISTAVASTTTVYGLLRASRANSSTFTLLGGNLNVMSGGTVDLGNSLDQISASSATVILASGTYAGQYGLVVNSGGNFTVYGATKTPFTTVSGNQTLGPGAFVSNFNVADAT